MRIPISPQKIRAIVTTTLSVVGILSLACPDVYAQVGGSAGKTPPPPSGAATSLSTNTQPDIQIVILPLPTGQYAVSSVYPKQVPKAIAQGRVDRLLALTKWKATNRRFSDAPAVPNPLRDGVTTGKLSAASFDTQGPIYGSDGTIPWEPFLQAFGDVRRINIICFTGTDFNYRGPVSFDSERITFSVSAGQGTVAAMANIKKKELSPVSFGLPQYVAIKGIPGQQANKGIPANRRTRGLQTAIILILALCSAVVFYTIGARFVTKT